MSAGPGDAMGNLVDKFIPFVFGLVGGLSLGFSALFMIPINLSSIVTALFFSVGTGAAVSYKAPLMEVSFFFTVFLFFSFK